MDDLKKYKGKIAVGIFQEGEQIFCACLAREKGQLKLISGQEFSLQKEESDSAEVRVEELVEQSLFTEDQGGFPGQPMEKPSNGNGDLSSLFEEFEDSEETDIVSDIQRDVLQQTDGKAADEFFLPPSKSAFDKNYVSVLHDIFKKLPRSAKVAFSIQEPLVYYATYFTTWGLSGQKLRQRILQELAKENADFLNIKDDEFQLLPTAFDGLVCVINDSPSDFKALVEKYEESFSGRFPNISFIESSDISLVNLVQMNYDFQPEEITVIVFVGSAYTRLIFLQGNELFHISPRIEEGSDSIIIFETIHKRINMEQDILNLPRIHRVITAGKAREMGVSYYLQRMFPDDNQIKVVDLQLKNVHVDNPAEWPDEKLTDYAIPIAAASRVLEYKNKKQLIQLDLLPAAIRDRQKMFKLGLAGWVIFLLIFLTTLFSTVRVGSVQKEISKTATQIDLKQLELDHLKSIEEQLFKAAKRLDHFKSTYGVLDSMMAGTKNFNGFLSRISRVARKNPGVWVSELVPQPGNKILLKGYSLYRSRISPFSDQLGNTVLQKVEVSEIRKQTVYYFELQAKIPLKEYRIKPPVNPAPAANPASRPAKPVRKIRRVQATSPETNSPASGDFTEQYNLALALFNDYQYEKAISHLQDLLKRPGNNSLKLNCRYWIGESYYGLKKYSQASTYFAEVSKRSSSKKAPALYMLGKCYAHLGKPEQALATMDQVIATFPDNDYSAYAIKYKQRLGQSGSI